MDLTLLIAIGGIAVLVLLLVLFVLSRIKVAGPNQAFIVTGRQGREVTSASGITSWPTPSPGMTATRRMVPYPTLRCAGGVTCSWCAQMGGSDSWVKSLSRR